MEGRLEACADCGRRLCWGTPPDEGGRLEEAERGRRSLRAVPSLPGLPWDVTARDGAMSRSIVSSPSSSSLCSVCEGVTGRDAGECQMFTGPAAW